MKNNKLRIVFMLCVTVLSIGRSCRGMTATESSVETHVSRNQTSHAISSLEMYHITRQMPVNFQKLTEKSTQVSFFRIESIDEVDVQNVIHHLAEATNRILLEYDGYGDIWVGGATKFEEIFAKACDMADKNNRDVMIFLSHADFLIDWTVANKIDDGKMLSAFHKILYKYKDRQDIQLVVHTKLLDGYSARPWWSGVERIKLESPNACEREDLIFNAFKKEGISMGKEIFDRVVGHTNGWTWTKILLEIRKTIVNVKSDQACVIVLQLHESMLTKSIKQCKQKIYSIRKFFEGFPFEEVMSLAAGVLIGGGALAISPSKYQARPKISEKTNKEAFVEESSHQELEELSTSSCIL
ncbi:hypothetical protein KJZ61_01650 [Candidatus Dependentiae bacterium]|nr:hypothetical protein [Candidatus Dependentiae bacterium]